MIGSGLVPFGSKLQSAELGRCDFSGSNPLCRASFVALTPGSNGLLQSLGSNQAVTQIGGNWLFVGNMLPIPISAQARAHLMRRVDGTSADSYAKSLSVSIQAQAGLQCAQVTQQNLSGQDQTLAYYKPATSANVLSVWSTDSVNNAVSLDPSTGATRGADDIWFPLTAGATGDAIVRNFYRSGRQLKVALFSDSACTSPFTPTGASTSIFALDLPGVPPLDQAMSTLPWPVLAPATGSSLSSLTAAAAAKISLSASWSFNLQPAAFNAAQFCLSAQCDGANQAINLPLSAAARSAAMSGTNGSNALSANSFKQLRLQGFSADGLLLIADYQSCAADTAGQSCSANALSSSLAAPRKRTRLTR